MGELCRQGVRRVDAWLHGLVLQKQFVARNQHQIRTGGEQIPQKLITRFGGAWGHTLAAGGHQLGALRLTVQTNLSANIRIECQRAAPKSLHIQ